MTTRRTLALVVSPRADDELVEFLRVLAALVATGHEVRLLTLPGAPPLLDPDLRDDATRYLDALSGYGTRPAPATPAALRAALSSCDALLLLADPARPGAPPVLDVTDALLTEPYVSDADLLALVTSAGQVVRRRETS